MRICAFICELVPLAICMMVCVPGAAADDLAKTHMKMLGEVIYCSPEAKKIEEIRARQLDELIRTMHQRSADANKFMKQMAGGKAGAFGMVSSAPTHLAPPPSDAGEEMQIVQKGVVSGIDKVNELNPVIYKLWAIYGKALPDAAVEIKFLPGRKTRLERIIIPNSRVLGTHTPDEMILAVQQTLSNLDGQPVLDTAEIIFDTPLMLRFSHNPPMQIRVPEQLFRPIGPAK